MSIVIILGVIILAILLSIKDYQNSPKCNWCKSRHYGRCIYNPKAGKIFSNSNDGHFDFNNPNS